MNRPTLHLCMTLMLMSGVITGCGSGSSDPAPQSIAEDSKSDPVSEVEPEIEPSAISLLDSVPAPSATVVDPAHTEITFSHFGHSDFTVELSGPCRSGTMVRRELVDMGNTDFDELLDHKVRCPDLAANAAYTTGIKARRADDQRFSADISFATGIGNSQPVVTVLDSVTTTRDAVNDLFKTYVETALTSELNVSAGVEALVTAAVLSLADAEWGNLVSPGAIYDVTAQRVAYPSRDPRGDTSNELTGLVVMPATSGAFVQRDQVIVLSHATSSTPSDLDATDGWYIAANVLASHGYLVVAADNWGRGGTAGEAETYLMANRTAINSVDLVRAVLADETYDNFYSENATPKVTIIGYSQGGHSAVAVWHLLQTQQSDISGPINIEVSEVYSGAGPHNLYQTFRGALEYVDGRCDGGAYCRYVDTDTVLTYGIGRILPGLLSYTDTGLSESDIVEGNTFATQFITGVLNNEPAYNKLKALLQQSSFNNIKSVATSFAGPTTLTLYHSNYDRLVPQANTQELAELLAPHVTVDHRSDRCNGNSFERIFDLTDQVGIIHTLCGLTMLDEVLGNLR